MYFIDREKLESILVFMEDQFQLLDEHTVWTSPVEVRALERITHILIEGFLDVGNQMIDGFIMRDPGSYEDIVAILTDESVLSKTQEEAFLALVHLRKELVQNYMAYPTEKLVKVIETYQSVWREFPDYVRRYLNTELGPVSAFKPTKE